MTLTAEFLCGSVVIIAVAYGIQHIICNRYLRWVLQAHVIILYLLLLLGFAHGIAYADELSRYNNISRSTKTFANAYNKWIGWHKGRSSFSPGYFVGSLEEWHKNDVSEKFRKLERRVEGR